MAFSLAICGAVFLNDGAKTIAAALPSIPQDQIQQLLLGTSTTVLGNLSPANRDLVIQSLVTSLRKM
jgi:hypothetical protein